MEDIATLSNKIEMILDKFTNLENRVSQIISDIAVLSAKIDRAEVFAESLHIKLFNHSHK
jgi:predicted  nucleic acid-binding Zn-ribbon protein